MLGAMLQTKVQVDTYVSNDIHSMVAINPKLEVSSLFILFHALPVMFWEVCSFIYNGPSSCHGAVHRLILL